MLTPAYVNTVSFFYPLGNTPAVCLTQDLPRSEKAKVLLLGCGDVRNILFTAYSDGGSASRQIDITCCDIESAVLARNILLLALLMDDMHGSNDEVLWNIYYHFFLDGTSIKFLHEQAEKLIAVSGSTQTWHDSQYGRFLRLCDQGTLAKVRKVWKSYRTANLSGEEKATSEKQFRLAIQKAMERRTDFLGPGVILTGTRSAGPVGVQSLKDLPLLYDHFWKYGVTDSDPEHQSQATFPNPTFASLTTDNLTLHYGTDPLLGFHLATAYIPLTPKSPLNPCDLGRSDLAKAVEAARLEFRSYSIAVQRYAGCRMTIRFCCGEALALCHTLQQARLDGGDNTANLYYSPHRLEPLVLDGADYNAMSDAPLSFNVIDTSNLVDHIGAVNVLVAASPLLEDRVSSVLYTESLAKREKNVKVLLDNMLCGNFATMSVLLGLCPTEYWTNATSISTVDEALLGWASRASGDKNNHEGQMRCRLHWRRQISSTKARSSVRWNEADLALILYQVYLNMFRNEDAQYLLSGLDVSGVRKHSLLNYHRGSLAAFLRFVKDRVDLNWDEVMEAFLNFVETDTNIMLGMNYIQELQLHLHLLKVHSVPIFQPSFYHVQKRQGLRPKGLVAWDSLPPVVCITLRIPRAKLQGLVNLPPAILGAPIVQGVLESSKTSTTQWQNIFAAVHLKFGEIRTHGSRDEDRFNLDIMEDVQGWMGVSDLFASFYVPTFVVLQDPVSAIVAFRVQTTLQSMMTLVKVLGPEMELHKANIRDESNVYITKYPPRLPGYPLLCQRGASCVKDDHQPAEADHTTITANIDKISRRIVAFTGHLSLLSSDAKTTLSNGAIVEVLQTSPFVIGIKIGDNGCRYQLEFPVPVLGSQTKTRIARKSSYVEVTVPIADPASGDHRPDLMYPLLVNGRDPVNLNMPRLNLDSLPIIDIAKHKELQWLTTHTSFMFSTRERVLRESATGTQDTRVNFKDSLFSMFMQFSGQQGDKARIFGIYHPTAGGVHILILVSHLRLDIANQTVVLDAAIMPLTHRIIPKAKKFHASIQNIGLCNIKVDDAELVMWKQVTPAWVERCRQWDHRSSCEYTHKQIPLSIEHGETPLCSCGAGSIPPRFISNIPGWDSVSRYAVRAAISPCFSVPYVEEVFREDFDLSEKLAQAKSAQCKVCGRQKSENNGDLLRCARCHDTQYCSAKCQRDDWKSHKMVCARPE